MKAGTQELRDEKTQICPILIISSDELSSQYEWVGIHVAGPGVRFCLMAEGFPPDYWVLHHTTGLCTRLLGSAQVLGSHPNTEFVAPQKANRVQTNVLS